MQGKSMPLKANKGTFPRLLGLIFKAHGFKVTFVILFMSIATFSNIGAMYTIQYVIKEALRLAGNGLRDFHNIAMLILLMATLYVTNIIFSYIYLRIMISVGQDTLVVLRQRLFAHMIRLPLEYFDTNRHGDLMSRYTNDVDATRQMISQSLPQLLISGLTLIGYLIAMFLTSYVLSFITIFFTLILFFITRVITKKSRRHFRAQQVSLGKINGFIEEMIEGQKVVKVFRHENAAVRDFSVLNEDLYNSARLSTMRTGFLIPITINLSYLGFAITAMSGAYLVYSGFLIIPALVGYLLFTRNFTGPLNQISQQLNFVQMALAGASRVFSVFDEIPETDNGRVRLVNIEYVEGKAVITAENTNIWGWSVPDRDEPVLLAGDVRFHNVEFAYKKGRPVLKHISLFAKPGQKIAFVGSTGAGKTTVTNLINRFYEIKDGVITYDGINIKDIEKASLRRSLGIVLQDTNLFTDTVRENIRYGKLDATDEEVTAAARLANAHEFIMRLPEGYDTVLTDDAANLSRGQRQLLAIARAALSNPPVLILDEATSSVDTYTEKLIQKSMDKLMEGRTVFVIAHRLSTIKNAEAIILLENGIIVERGSHEDLIEKRGLYYQLYTGVFELR